MKPPKTKTQLSCKTCPLRQQSVLLISTSASSWQLFHLREHTSPPGKMLLTKHTPTVETKAGSLSNPWPNTWIRPSGKASRTKTQKSHASLCLKCSKTPKRVRRTSRLILSTWLFSDAYTVCRRSPTRKQSLYMKFSRMGVWKLTRKFRPPTKTWRPRSTSLQSWSPLTFSCLQRTRLRRCTRWRRSRNWEITLRKCLKICGSMMSTDQHQDWITNCGSKQSKLKESGSFRVTNSERNSSKYAVSIHCTTIERWIHNRGNTQKGSAFLGPQSYQKLIHQIQII